MMKGNGFGEGGVAPKDYFNRVSKAPISEEDESPVKAAAIGAAPIEAEVGSTPATGSHAAPTDEDTNFHNETTFESTTNPPTESNTPPRYAWMANLERPQGNFPTNGNVEKRSNNSTDVSDDLSQCISKLVSCRGEYLDAQQDLDRVLQRFIEQYAELKTDLVRTQDLFVGSERELTQKRTEVESMNNELSDCREKLAILDDVKRRLSAL